MEVQSSVVFVLLATLILMSCSQEKNKSLPDPETRASLTLKGIFNYYWKSDPRNKSIEFLFACGQLGQIGPGSGVGQCSCVVPKVCTNCYRWFTAVMMEALATHSIRTNSSEYSTLPEAVFDHSPYNGNWNATAVCTYVDDFLWYGIAYLQIHEWLQDEKWLNRSLDLYEWAWKYGWDDPCGGFFWSTCHALKYKFNIQHLEALHFASRLAYTLPNRTQYLSDAEKIWNWFFSFGDGYGLMSDEYLVSTGAYPLRCCNATSANNTCVNGRNHDGAYNQGLLMSSAAYLFLITGNRTYLNTGLRAFDAIVQNYTTKEGVLRDEPRGFPNSASSCSFFSDPGGDWFSFNGVFMLHLGYFTQLLVKNKSMPSDTLSKIRDLVQKSSDSAWSNSSVWPPFNQTNACKPGSDPVNSTASYPKFHWWWGERVDYVSWTPTDPGQYFKKPQLQCHTTNGNDSQIWNGRAKNQDACMAECDSNVNCSKYSCQQFGSNLNCSLWGYNRTDHICNDTSPQWIVGVKRPSGQLSCTGKCGSTEPQKFENSICYCDSNCSRHLDCCLDYANECQATQTPSCEGRCKDILPQPLLGGGYCWCSGGCVRSYTGGGCCADYQHFCQGATIQPCLDGRTQAAAFNLFLSHSMICTVTEC